jgi:hypothetical protein
MPRTPRLALLWLAASAILIALPLPAQAVPIHRHVWSKKPLPDGVHQPLLLRVVKLDVAPPYVPPKPAPVAPAPAVSAPTLAAPSVAPTAASGTPPEYIASCESGGDYGAVNPSSGAYGKWQILPSTSSAYGCDMSSPAGQDACAAEIYSDVGSSAWACG